MNPPDVYDAAGRPYGRREDDLDPATAHGWDLWARVMFVHRGKLIAVVATLASALSCAATAIGLRYVGPKQDLQAVDHKVDTLSARVVRFESSLVIAREERDDTKRTLGWVIYMQCVSTKRSDPAALPPICDEAKKP